MQQLEPRTTDDALTYYNDLVASVRLDPDLEARLERAASLRGESKSDFIRAAVAERVEATLGSSLADRLAHVIGKIDLGESDLAEHAHERARELIIERHRSQVERWQRGS